MKTKFTKVILSVFIVISFVSLLISNLYSHSTGMTGFTYHTGGEGCSCHGSSPTPAVIVSFMNADSVAVGQTKSIRIKIQGGSKIAGGFDVAVLNGVLNVNSSADPNVQKIGTELTHTAKKLFSGDTVSWTFNYTAPNSTGWDTLYACGNSTNNNGSSSGDTWNFRIRFPVKIYTPTSVQSISETAKGYELNQNYPNPFNPVTNIKFSLQKSDFVSLKIYDITGREVANLINKNLKAGEYVYDFNASELSSGVYIYKLSTGDFTSTKKMTLIK
jgi:hypothetical protein